jgi:hypothetical protein
VFGGISNESGDLDRQGSLAAYWTSRDPSSSADGWLGRSWNIHAGDGGGWPVVNGSSASISTGRSLRCVRDN